MQIAFAEKKRRQTTFIFNYHGSVGTYYFFALVYKVEKNHKIKQQKTAQLMS